MVLYCWQGVEKITALVREAEMNWRTFWLFVLKVVTVHTATYFIAGQISITTILGPYVYGPKALTMYYKDPSAFGPWVLPDQILRGILLAIALYPFRERILELGKKGGLAIASIYLLVGQFACPGTSPGSLEGFVYTRIPIDFQFAVLPEIIGQGLALGFLLYWWESYSARKLAKLAA